ncbi:translation initiation factor IF-2 [Cytophagales bacterium LB-30]|uniref:Translation initiation factor IF-2 n=1 Tax=Shiella aurantiaca TaxID=3058365 RepID=A0ABT8F3D5_9BACT|nr:translation initiation factor IF-2 [Shiella aurantiaca]MDN4164511.1 translation initiation factor IF-2 [Shiella aurantiaca]
MSEDKMMRLSQVARKLNVGTSTIIDHLASKGHEVENNPNSKITIDLFNMLAKEFASSAMEKEEASSLTIGKKHNDLVIDGDPVIEPSTKEREKDEEQEILIKNVSVPKQEEKPAAKEDEKVTLAGSHKLQGIKVLGKIDLDKKEKPAEPAAPAPKAEEPKKEEPKAPAPKVEAAPAPKVEVPKEEVKPKVEAVKEEPKKEAPKEPVKETPAPPKVEAKTEETPAAPEESQLIEAKADTLKGLTVLGKIELPSRKEKPVASSDDRDKKKGKRPRKRINKPGEGDNRPAGGGQGNAQGGGPNRGNQQARPGNKNAQGNFKKVDKLAKEDVSDKEIQDQIKATLAKLSGGGTKKGASAVNRSKYRRDKRSAAAEAEEERMLAAQEDAKILKVNEFISANDLATLMDVSVNQVISTCMSLGMFVSINQRLDAEAITIIADEFGYDVQFASTEEEADILEEDDAPEDLKPRAPIVTIMGHVDHGKTSLLDYIRNTKVTAGEAGGITQHIGAYDVTTDTGKRITFLDTPGHEAFTAMRARGAKVTDIVIIVVAADDNVMPQTKEAINHAQVAGVPIVIAINKIDKPNANPDKIKEELSKINILVEDWGGKYQCQHISAKTGVGIDDLLEKVLLEAELLDLKANPDKKAVATVVEASLDKGRGYVATVLVESGTLHVGDIILAGSNHGRVKAMFDHKGQKMKEAGPSMPVLILGLDGAPQSGDKMHVMDTEREARELSNKREQLLREQSIRTKKHITLDEIGRRLAIGSFKELNVIVKADFDGSVEALSDSLLKLSTTEVQVNIIHKGVGQISESDVLLASASDAIIVGFQVRPSSSARKLAENEQIEIRLYSIIYDAINEVKDAMEGMLAPKIEEVITATIQVREVFKISKVGTVAGCMVTDGTLKRSHQVRLIRDGIVVFTGKVDALKRFKEDVAEVRQNYECGISLKGFNDIMVGDEIEGFEEKEVKRTL